MIIIVGVTLVMLSFQSALRFAVVSDLVVQHSGSQVEGVFQSALRFAVVSDVQSVSQLLGSCKFQSALRFAVVSDLRRRRPMGVVGRVSIRFEVRGGFRR